MVYLLRRLALCFGQVVGLQCFMEEFYLLASWLAPPAAWKSGRSRDHAVPLMFLGGGIEGRWAAASAVAVVDTTSLRGVCGVTFVISERVVGLEPVVTVETE